MKRLVFAALLVLGAAAAPALAQSSYDWRYREEIRIQDHGRDFTFDRRDRVFGRLLSSPFNFRPGLTYVYTDHCGRRQCEVLAYSRHLRSPVNRLWAPHIWDIWDDDHRHDGHWDDDYRGDDHWNGDKSH